MKNHIPDLHVEFASDKGTYHYLSVIEFRREKYLVVVDNITQEGVGAYVLDFAQQEGLDLQQLISVVTTWFYRASYRYPLSFEFSRLGMAQYTNRIYKSFELGHVTRLIGNDFKYDLAAAPKVRRRRVNMIPAGIEISLRRVSVAS